MARDLFHLPAPLPAGAVFIGPENWPEAVLRHDRENQHFSDPDLGLKWLLAGLRSANPPARLVFIHQDAFAGEHGTDRLVDWLRELGERRGPFLPRPLSRQCGGAQACGLFPRRSLRCPVGAHRQA